MTLEVAWITSRSIAMPSMPELGRRQQSSRSLEVAMNSGCRRVQALILGLEADLVRGGFMLVLTGMWSLILLGSVMYPKV